MTKSFTVRDPFTPYKHQLCAGPKTERPREITRQCAVCGENILVKICSNDAYTGGHYFGKIPLHTEKEFKKALKAGTTKERWGKTVVEILKKDPKPYSHAEYWECNKCYFAKD